MPELDDSQPRVSVVIPTGGHRPRRLIATLEALAAQGLPRGEMEVIVSCDPGVQVPPAPAGLAVRVVEAPAAMGAAANRNLGWREARAPLVAFTDDDCRPAPGWIEALLSAAAGAPEAFLQGRTEPDPTEIDALWGFARSMRVTSDSPWQESCNIAYPRALLERLGGFNEGYGLVGGEDTDLGWRALELGAPKRYVEAALVWHAVERQSFRQALTRARHTRDQPQVLARFPELRRELTLGLFYWPEHALLLLALAGVLSRRPALAALAAVPYVERHLRHYVLTPKMAAIAATHLPVRAFADAITMAVVARRGLERGVLAL